MVEQLELWGFYNYVHLYVIYIVSLIYAVNVFYLRMRTCYFVTSRSHQRRNNVFLKDLSLISHHGEHPVE